MRLGYVFNFQGGGGATSQAWMLARAFNEVKDIELTCVNAVELGLMRPLRDEIEGMKVEYPHSLGEYFRMAEFDVVLVHSYNAGFTQEIVRNAGGAKVGVRSGSNFLEYHITQVISSNPRWLTDLMTDMGELDFMIAPSKYHEKQLRYLYPELMIRTIPVGINVGAFIPTKYKVDGRLNVLVACRHAPNNFVAGILAVARKMPEVKFWIIGMGVGAYVGVIRTLMEKWELKNVEFLGYVDEETRMKLYEIADVLCVPSVSHNGVPVSVLEALAAGTVVIASDLPVLEEVRGAVERVRLDDFEAWEDRIRKCDEDVDWVRKRIRKGLKVVERYDMERVVGEYLELFKEVMG